MKIWIDADACPVPIKDIVMRAALRRHIQLVFVANKKLALPESPFISFIQVDSAADAADTYIKDHAASSDLVITQDIPLAAALVPAGVTVIDPRGDIFTHDNVLDRLSMRNFMQEMRDSGEVSGGPRPFTDTDKRNFASTFDREITRLLKSRTSNPDS